MVNTMLIMRKLPSVADLGCCCCYHVSLHFAYELYCVLAHLEEEWVQSRMKPRHLLL